MIFKGVSRWWCRSQNRDPPIDLDALKEERGVSEPTTNPKSKRNKQKLGAGKEKGWARRKRTPMRSALPKRMLIGP